MTRPGIELRSPGPLANTLPLSQWAGKNLKIGRNFSVSLCLPVSLSLSLSVSFSLFIYLYMYVCVRVCVCVLIPTGLGLEWIKLATLVEGEPMAPVSLATTPKCNGGRYSFLWITPLYLWSSPYHAEC